MTASLSDNEFDAEADEIIQSCLNLHDPKSFFLFAGAGSGKTRSLVTALRNLLQQHGKSLVLSGRKVAVITYTNAACDEIKQRIEFDPRIDVSTIHSFAWSLISGFDEDIRSWLSSKLARDIAELEEKQRKGRAGKASLERARSIESKTRRREQLGEIQRFVYSPTGDNRTRDALNHSEVISMTAQFLTEKPGLRRQLITRYPVLLIDESQDTTSSLMDAFLSVQKVLPREFSIGLLGDTMQRIYADGKVGLAESVPGDWARPKKVMNHRCPKRVVELINKIRADDDGQAQQWRSDAKDGFVRLFLAPETATNKAQIEEMAVARMSELTGDTAWVGENADVKTLALEHMMSARRFGFENFFAPLYGYEPMRTGLLDGTGRGIGFFTRELLPLSKALEVDDRFAAAMIVRKSSPLLDKKMLAEATHRQKDLLQNAKKGCDGFGGLLVGDAPATLRQVLQYVAKVNLFQIPEILQPFIPDHSYAADDEDAKSELGAWRMALEAPFAEIEKYDRYVRGLSQFDTHQGVKGLEFPRVMVVISDDEARGFLFNYGKLMGTKGKTDTDLKNETEGKDTSIARTRRLFYVTCSRAEESLAVVYYSDDTNAARDAIMKRGWFAEDEIEVLQ